MGERGELRGRLEKEEEAEDEEDEVFPERRVVDIGGR